MEIPGDIKKQLEALQQVSVSPISNYQACAVGISKDREILRGTNIEFPGLTLNESVHAEQALIAVAHSKEIKELSHLYLSASPCGHCRQFLNELSNRDTLIISWKNTEYLLRDLLPESFSPSELGNAHGALDSPPNTLKLAKNTDDGAVSIALHMASRSYAPYTKCFGGVALRLHDGRIAKGAYIENVAFNPTLSPTHSALAFLLIELKSGFSEIESGVLVRTGSQVVDHEATFRRLLPATKLQVIEAGL